MNIYAISVLIAQKAQSDRVPQPQIKKELQELLGITYSTLSDLITSKHPQEKGRIAPAQLIKLSNYFGVPIDSLINPDLRESVLIEHQISNL